ALNFARRTFQWMDAHMHDDEYGGYFQFVERDGTPLKEGWEPHPAKDQNSSIHILEAFTELYTIWPDEHLRDRLAEMLILVRDTITTDPGTLQLFFHADWTPISYRDSTEAARQANYNMDHVSYGHDVETAFLMLEAAHALGLDPALTLAAGKRMVDHALAYGWDDEVGGIYDGGYYLDPNAPPMLINNGKTWWAQAEMLNTMLLMAQHFPNDERGYYNRFETMWRYIQKYLVDPEHAGWYWGGIDQEPDYKTAPKGSIWKASYHDGRALMNVVHLLEDAP
ncbi:MAG TPA: AGE family epimerase/isomerase, partial [Rhodothermales bacterium]|nr:AGE family epimerase/isomerase [Rhodothermales bacterium]